MNTCQCNEAGAGMACVGQKRQGSGFRVFVTKSACFEMEGGRRGGANSRKNWAEWTCYERWRPCWWKCVTGRLLHWMWSRMMQCWPQRIKKNVVTFWRWGTRPTWWTLLFKINMSNLWLYQARKWTLDICATNPQELKLIWHEEEDLEYSDEISNLYLHGRHGVSIDLDL